nr:helix-turn-helix domain-containing protein [Caulobacter sp. FWC26]
MSDKELSRLEVLRDLTSGRLTVAAAGELLGLERRQVLRLSKAYQEQGATAPISKKRGRTSNRATPSRRGRTKTVQLWAYGLASRFVRQNTL